MSFSLSEYTKIDVGWGFAPDPTGKLTAPPDPYSWLQGGRFTAGGKWKEGLGERGRKGKRGNGEGRGKGGSWEEERLCCWGDRRL